MNAFKCKACVETSCSAAEIEKQVNPGCPYCGADKQYMTEEVMKNCDTCVCCGDYIPEGRMVCVQCEKDPQHALKKEVKMFEIKDVSDMDIVRGGNIQELLPPMQDIPNDFGILKNNKWSKFISDWFFCGVEELKLVPKAGVDPVKAIRHIRAILSSFEPKHEHKEAGCAYLMSLWFDDVQYKTSSKGRFL